MIYVGIDVAKDKHEFYILDDDAEVLVEDGTFYNNINGFTYFLNEVDKLCLKDHLNVKMGLEATGHYSFNLLSFLIKQGFSVTEFNPLTVSLSRKAATLRRTKTDKNDSRYIAELLLTDKTEKCKLDKSLIHTLKSLTRARYHLVKELSGIKNRYRKCVHVLFPEIDTCFSTLYGSSVLEVLRHYPSAKHIAKSNLDRLSTILRSSSHGMLGLEKAKNLQEVAKNSIATFNKGDALELKLIVERMDFILEQEKILEDKINKIMDKLNSPITTIPGISNIIGAIILGEIGNIKNFSGPEKLLAYAGAEPSTYQSGKFTATITPMVKHGSRYLRNALYLATTSAFLHNPDFKDYINKKRAQGKHYYTAISHGMKKMTRIIFTILKNNVPYKIQNTQPISN